MTAPTPGRHCPGDERELVLASASPRRRELLLGLGLRFEVDAATGDEALPAGIDAAAAVTALALAKAREVASRHPTALIVAADTIVALGGRLLGKPGDADDARTMLHALSDHDHRVLTGLIVLDAASAAYESRVVETRVRFRALADTEIDAYVRTGEPLDKAGAYGIQGLGAVFVAGIEGDYSNVVGLPLAALNDLLRNAGACLICRRLRA